MQRRGVYDRPEPRLSTREERARRNAKRRNRDSALSSLAGNPDLSSLSIKRLAWAFGCARPDSEAESKLYRALVEKILKARGERK